VGAEAVPAPSTGRAAALVSVITIASRAMGVVRTLVVTAVLGITYLGNTYSSANALPNLLFEIIAGGAIAAALLPALAAPAASRDREAVGVIASGVLNRALLITTPVVLLGVLLREPLMRALTSEVPDAAVRAQEIELGAFLLILFLPQLWLYVFGVVLTGVLHAYHRFVMPALAPLLSSVVVTASYLLYAFIEGPGAERLDSISNAGRLVLGLGTTFGVVVLSFCLLPAVRGLGIRWKPTLAMPEEARRKIRALVFPAILTVGAQQVFLGVVLVLANRVEGGVVAYQLAFTALLVFWAVFPLPMATTMFPGLAASASDPVEFGRRSSEAVRKVTVIVLGAAALLFAVADPAARLVVHLGAGADAGSRQMVALTIAGFAPGLVGYGLYALFTRAAYALGDGKGPAVAAVVGFGLGIGLNVAASRIFDGPELIGSLGAGFSIGISASVLLLVVKFRSRAGRGALAGAGLAFGRSIAAASAAAAVGLLVAAALASGSLSQDLLRAAAVSAATVATYLAVVMALGERELTGALLPAGSTS
jgi:putative peptidoglycan lipid II flippase